MANPSDGFFAIRRVKNTVNEDIPKNKPHFTIHNLPAAYTVLFRIATIVQDSGFVGYYFKINFPNFKVIFKIIRLPEKLGHA